MKQQWFKKNYIIIAVLIITLLPVGVIIYNNLSREGIYLKVLDRKGYEVYKIKEKVTFLAVVKPEWIPKTANEEKIVKKKVAEVEGVEVFLDNVIHRGHDIYFSFTVHPQIQFKEGKFLSTLEFNENGTVTQGMPNEIYLYNDAQDIEIGQWGLGPLDMVSFGVEVDEFEKIRNGFNFKYSGFKLYGYQKN